IEAKVPDILPEELASRLASDENIVLFDVRTLEEHQRFCIPGALSVPGGDLILWAEDLARNSATTYLMHCAGRTRSVIGTQTLRRLGVSNVFALRNGTMGWILAGLEPERNAGRIPPNPSSSSRMAAEKLASRIAKEEGISTISVTELQELHESREGRSVYVVDVRSPAEFLQGHIPGSLSIPGGQAVQRTDDFIAVREAKIVFVSDGQARATMTAYWFKQMGFDNVSVLEGGIERWVKGGNRLSTKVLNPENGIIDEARRTVRTLPPTDLVSFVASTDALVLHVGSSSDFEKGHLPKSLWVSRGWMEIKTNELCPNKSLPIILTCADGRQSVLAARTLQRLGYAAVKVLQGGVDGWNEQGHPIEKGLEGHCVVEPKDSVVPASASGNKEAMVGYLNWELALGEKFKGGADG
ncbi:MAG: sulfurtransferase, partial [Deltaproteobacteria bacterium]|nr:sulfurtransferase [Deltaproteobacteria bacterium]